MLKSKKILLPIILIFVIFLYFFLVTRQETPFSLWSENFKDIDGRDVFFPRQSNSTLVFLAFDPEITFHKRVATFIGALAIKYRLNGLSVFGISVKSNEVTKEYRNLTPLSFPLIVDKGEKLLKVFNWEKCCGGLAVLKAGQMTFSSGALINEESVRQLVEKSLFGKVTYDHPSLPPRSSEEMEIILKSVLFRKAYSDQRFLFDEIRSHRKLVFTVMSVLCSACQSGKRLSKLKEIYETNGNFKENVSFILVLSDPFTEHDLESVSAGMEIPFPIYFANGIFSREEILVT